MPLLRVSMILGLVLIVSCVHADATLDNVSFGSHVAGPAVSQSDLAGHVVLFEFWGVNCGPCLANIPHVSQMQAKFGSENFIVIANQCQDATDAVAQSTWQSRAVNDLVCVINRGNLTGSAVTGIPHCFLFDEAGNKVFEGSPADVEPSIEATMKKSIGALVFGHTYTKLQSVASVIGQQSGNFAAAIKKLHKTSDGADAQAKDEADFLLGRLKTWSDAKLAQIQDLRTAQPAQVPDLLAKMINLLHGDDMGKPFEALAKDLKKDKAFMSELQAAEMLSQIKAQAKQCGLSADPKEFLSHASNQDKAASLVSGLQQVCGKFPKTVAATEAKQLALSWTPNA